MEFASLLLILFAYFAGMALVIAGTVDAFGFSPQTWSDAGLRRAHWVWQAAGAFVLPAGLVYSGIYFARIRPRLTVAYTTLAGFDPDYVAWMARRRWYDRFVYARRSPERWAKAARQWWGWALNAVVAALFAGFWWNLSYGSAPHWQRHPGAEVDAIGWAALALLSAARAGFWYGEHMRLTGRRPAAGGRLYPRPDDPRDR